VGRGKPLIITPKERAEHTSRHLKEERKKTKCGNLETKEGGFLAFFESHRGGNSRSGEKKGGGTKKAFHEPFH